MAEAMLNIGIRLKQAREDAGLTQAELGDALEVGANAISKIETGRSALTLQHLAKLPAILNKPAAWFLDLPPPPGLTAEEQELMELIRALPPSYAEMLTNLLRAARRPLLEPKISAAKRAEWQEVIDTFDLYLAVHEATPAEREALILLLLDLKEEKRRGARSESAASAARNVRQ